MALFDISNTGNFAQFLLGQQFILNKLYDKVFEIDYRIDQVTNFLLNRIDDATYDILDVVQNIRGDTAYLQTITDRLGNDLSVKTVSNNKLAVSISAIPTEDAIVVTNNLTHPALNVIFEV